MSEQPAGDEAERAARQPILPSVRTSLADIDLRPRDAAAAALAVRYAELLDEAVAAQKYATALRVMSRFVEWNNNGPADQRKQVEQAWDKISAALSEHSVASDLGPKLLAALDKLALTRPPIKPEPSAPATTAEVTPMTNPLELLQDDAKERWGASRS